VKRIYETYNSLVAHQLVMLICVIIHLPISAQFHPDSFTIGMAESTSTMLTDSLQQTGNMNYACYNRLTFLDTIFEGHPSSHFNVFAEDGFNTVMPMAPAIWGFSEYRFKTYLQLAKKFNIQIIPFAGDWFVPLNGKHDGNGINVYDNNLHIPPMYKMNDSRYQDPYENCKARTNFDFFFDHVFCDSSLRDVVKGYHLGGELNHVHLFNPGTERADFSAKYMVSREVPPANVNDATVWFKERKAGNQKTYLSYVNHGASFHYDTDDAEYNGTSYQNSPIDYNIGDYFRLLNMPDVSMEDSYFRWTNSMDKDWVKQPYSNIKNNGPTCAAPEECNRHYLAKFKNIDFLHGMSPEVIATFTFERYWQHDGQNFDDEHYNSTKVNNANFMWFQVYTSIIHGVNGIMFYGLDSYSKDETAVREGFGSMNVDRYERKYRSEVYNKFMAPLSKELRYLSNNGFLTPSKETVLYAKKDEVDRNNIVPPAKSYIPRRLPDEKKTENYGLRYTIRENSENEVIMIVSNPLNTTVSVDLDFSKIANSNIQSAKKIELLFQTLNESVSSKNYKVNRNSNIDFDQNTIDQKQLIDFNSNEPLKLKFGPLDVLILKFVSNSTKN